MIRKFKNNDLEQILKIWLNVNIETHNFISKNYWMENFNVVKKILPEAEIYVYEKAEKIIGFIGLNDNYIAGIFVASDEKSKGIGKKLINYVKSLKKQLLLKVYVKNEKAIKFYQKEDFKIKFKDVDEFTKEKELLMLWEKL